MRRLSVVTAALMLTLPSLPARSQELPATEAIVTQLSNLQTPSELEAATLRQQVADRVKSKVDAIALKRPPIAPELNKLPRLNLDIQFNPDTPVIRPQSYRAIARIADALTTPALMGHTFLVVGHTESTGRREINLTLSQRRAEAIRDALVQTYKISAKRVLAVGLGEEQLLDANNPKAVVNLQSQIVTLREVAPVAPAAKPPDAKKPSRSKGKKK